MCLFVLNFFKLNQGFGGYILFENQREPCCWHPRFLDVVRSKREWYVALTLQISVTNN